MSAAVALAVALGMALGTATPAAAQVDPRGRVRTIATPHLRVHYPAHLDSLARVSAVLAERAYGQLARELAPPRGVIDLLLADNTDVSNGFAQLFPSNRVVVYAVPPIASRELRFHDDWLRLVITHELAHVFHLDRARGVWRLGRWLFGRNPLFFPNAFTPSWLKEGLAVHYESALTGSGRLVATEFPVMLHAAAVDGVVAPMGRWSLSTTRWPRGQVAYGYGATLMQRAVNHAAAQADTMRGMSRFVEASARHVVPLRLDRNARVGFGASFSALWRQYVDSLNAAVAPRVAPAALDAPWREVSRDGWYVAAPRWLGNDSLVWSASTGREVTGLYAAPAAGGAARRVAWRNALDVNVPRDSSLTAMVFAQLERRDPFVLRSDLYLRDGGRDRRLTVGARLTQPDVRHDGTVVAVQYDANASMLVRVRVHGARITDITPLVPRRAGERWAEPRWSASGEEIVAVQLVPGGCSGWWCWTAMAPCGACWPAGGGSLPVRRSRRAVTGWCGPAIAAGACRWKPRRVAMWRMSIPRHGAPQAAPRWSGRPVRRCTNPASRRMGSGSWRCCSAATASTWRWLRSIPPGRRYVAAGMPRARPTPLRRSQRPTRCA
jgi:hypothetical protein